MSKYRFYYAIKDNQYIHIDYFDPGVGADCNCYCPQCGDPVQSKIKRSEDSDFTNRFAHLNDSNCEGGQSESDLHKLAKRILEQNKSLKIPPIADITSIINYEKVTLEPSIRSTSSKQFRPDLILHTNDDRKVAIEIFVTHRVSKEKAELYKNKELPCLEIDLSEYHNEILKYYHGDIQDAILKDLDSKKWIWPDKDETVAEPKTEGGNISEHSGCAVAVFFGLFFLAISSLIPRINKFGTWLISKRFRIRKNRSKYW